VSSTAAESPPLDVPDLLGDAGRARAVLAVLGEIQSKLIDLEVRQIADGFDDDRGSGVAVDGVELTLGQRRARLEEAQARIVERYSDLMPLISGLGGTGG
jgi:hypothetical protein